MAESRDQYVLRASAAALATIAALLAALLIQLEVELGSPWTVLMLAAAAAIAERGNVGLAETTELSIPPVLTLFAAVLFGPLAGGLVGAASELGDSELFGDQSRG